MGLKEIDTHKRYTFEEYLALEGAAEERYEYHNGRIVAMAGGSGDHNKIAGRLITILNNAIDREAKACTVFNSDLNAIGCTVLLEDIYKGAKNLGPVPRDLSVEHY